MLKVSFILPVRSAYAATTENPKIIDLYVSLAVFTGLVQVPLHAYNGIVSNVVKSVVRSGSKWVWNSLIRLRFDPVTCHSSGKYELVWNHL